MRLAILFQLSAVALSAHHSAPAQTEPKPTPKLDDPKSKIYQQQEQLKGMLGITPDKLATLEVVFNDLFPELKEILRGGGGVIEGEDGIKDKLEKMLKGEF
jgi:hypothetical protein